MEKIPQKLSGVSETLLLPLYTRALESQRPDALLRDEQAVGMVGQIDYDFKRIRLQGHDAIALIMRVKKFDQYARDFLARNPDGVVIHIGCGLDTRFDRVDNGRVEWFDLDMPDVIQLRQKLIVGKCERYHLLATSVFEDSWMEEVKRFKPHPFMFLAEGVLPYFEEIQVKSLFLKLSDRFPGCEMVCDAHTPFAIRANNLQLAYITRVSARLHWGLRHGRDVETWGEGIGMLDEWFYFDTSEPRMQVYRWMKFLPFLGRSTGIFRYRLGILKPQIMELPTHA